MDEHCDSQIIDNIFDATMSDSNSETSFESETSTIDDVSLDAFGIEFTLEEIEDYFDQSHSEPWPKRNSSSTPGTTSAENDHYDAEVGDSGACQNNTREKNNCPFSSATSEKHLETSFESENSTIDDVSLHAFGIEFTLEEIKDYFDQSHSEPWPKRNSSSTPETTSAENDQQLCSKPLPHFEIVFPENRIPTRPLDDLLDEQQGRVNFGFEDDSYEEARRLFAEKSIQDLDEMSSGEYRSKSDSPPYQLSTAHFRVNFDEFKASLHSPNQFNGHLNIFDNLSSRKLVSRIKHRISTALKQIKKTCLPKCVCWGRGHKNESKK